VHFQRLPVERIRFTAGEIDDPDAAYFFARIFFVVVRGPGSFERSARDKRYAFSVRRPTRIAVVTGLRKRQKIVLAVPPKPDVFAEAVVLPIGPRRDKDGSRSVGEGRAERTSTRLNKSSSVRSGLVCALLHSRAPRLRGSATNKQSSN
jgi:hypothetical protein